MASITARLSEKVDSRGKSEILIRFIADKEHTFRLRSNIYVNPAKWNAEEQRVILRKLDTPERKELIKVQDNLEKLRTFLLTEYIEADKSRVDSAWMKKAVERFWHPTLSASEISFFDTFARFIKERDVSDERREHYWVVYRDLERFEKYLGYKLTFPDFDAELIRDFESFLQVEHTLPDTRKYKDLYEGMKKKELPKARSLNTIRGIMSKLRTFFLWCNTKHIIDSRPFSEYEIPDEMYGQPYYLTIDERDKIYALDLTDKPELEAQRDIFIFQCFTGARVGDLLKFKKSDIVNGVLEYIPHKTMGGTIGLVSVPLTDTAKEIVAKYSKFKGEKLFPFISREKYNDALKKIFLKAEINRSVSVLDPLTREEVKKPLYEAASSHLARRTFIGNLYKKVKDQNLVSSMSGHADGSRAFARYRTIDADMKKDVIKYLEKDSDTSKQ